MTLTAYPNGISSFGVPVLGGAGILSGGKHFFVDPANGSDGNVGTSWDLAFSTLGAALSACTAGKNDVVYLIGDGGTTGTARLSATLAWNKNATHLVGIAAPTRVSQRARIAPTSGVAAFSPLITVSANGCIFANFQAFCGFANEAGQSVCMNVTGQRNYFENIHIAGMGHAEAGDTATSASLALAGGDENLFKDCVIGLDTIARSTTNAEIDLSSAAVRNVFEDCYIVTFADNAGHLFVKADSVSDLDRFTIFRRCQFINAIASTATVMTAAMNVNAAAGGMVVVHDCMLIGATDWTAADAANVLLYGPNPGDASGANLNTGIALPVDVS